MYDNIGGKIKGLAKAICIILAVASFIVGIVLMSTSEYLAGYGFLVWLVGGLGSWISSWMLYGYGEIIDTLHDIKKNTAGEAKKPEATAAAEAEKAEATEE